MTVFSKTVGALYLVAATTLGGAVQAQDESAAQRLLASMTLAGCMVNGFNGDVVLGHAGLTEEEANSAIPILLEQGSVMFEDDGLRVLTGSCAEGINPIAAELFPAVVRAESLSAEDAAGLMAETFQQNNCLLAPEDTDRQISDLMLRVAAYTGITLPEPLGALPRDLYGDFFQAVVDLSTRGIDHLIATDQLEVVPSEGVRLVGCSAQ